MIKANPRKFESGKKKLLSQKGFDRSTTAGLACQLNNKLNQTMTARIHTEVYENSSSESGDDSEESNPFAMKDLENDLSQVWEKCETIYLDTEELIQNKIQSFIEESYQHKYQLIQELSQKYDKEILTCRGTVFK